MNERLAMSISDAIKKLLQTPIGEYKPEQVKKAVKSVVVQRLLAVTNESRQYLEESITVDIDEDDIISIEGADMMLMIHPQKTIQ